MQKSIFAHVQTYSRKGNGKSRSLRDIIDEAMRIPGACPHVEKPKMPILVEGIAPSVLLQELETSIAEQNKLLRALRKLHPERKANLRAIREDTHVMIASVFSYPEPLSGLNEHEYKRWRDDVLAFATDDALRNGAIVRSVIEHRDETHPHLHVFSLPICQDDNMRMDAKQCHVGHRRQTQHIEEKWSGSPSRSYKLAMKGWQDSYHQQVGSKHGQARTGPKRRRLDRATWKAEKERLESQKATAEAALATETALLARAQAEDELKLVLDMKIEELIAEAESSHVIANEGLLKALELQNAEKQVLIRLQEPAARALRDRTFEQKEHLRQKVIPRVSEGISWLSNPKPELSVNNRMEQLNDFLSDWVTSLHEVMPAWLNWGDMSALSGTIARRTFGLDFLPNSMMSVVEASLVWRTIEEQARRGMERAQGIKTRLSHLASNLLTSLR